MWYRILKSLLEKEFNRGLEIEDYGGYIRVKFNYGEMELEKILMLMDKAKEKFQGFGILIWCLGHRLDLYIGEEKEIDELELDGYTFRIA